MMIRKITWSCLLLLTTACSDGNKLPEMRPSGSVGGRIAVGIFSAGNVSLYAFQNGTRGEKLGGADLSPGGHYSVTLRAASQPILIEVATGRYKEEASDIQVAFADGQRLTALAWYESGAASTRMVTPFTHIATGLAEYKIAQGTPVRDAALAAQLEVSTALNFDIVGTSPLLVSEETTTSGLQTDSANYGFYLAAISNLTQWISTQNGTQPHVIFNSIGLSQILFDDVRADGKLDGRGWNKDATALMNLAYGTVPLDASLYRMALAQHLLAMTLHANNKSGLTFNNLLATAQAFANSQHLLFGGTAMIPPLLTAPAIVPVSATPQATVQRGLFNYKVEINGIIPATKVTYTLDDSDLGEVPDPKLPEMKLKTTQYAEGAHTLVVSATDALGNHATQKFALYFDNFFVTLNSPLITNKATYALQGEYGLNGGVLKSLLIQGQNAALIDTASTWHGEVNLTPGHNAVAMQLVDNLGHTEQYAFTIDLDVTPPSFDTSAGHSAARFSTGGGNYTDGKLSNSNDTQALFNPTDRTELKGTAIRRADLDGNAVAYFALKVSDPLTDGIASTPAQLKVNMSYERNGTVIFPARELKPVGGEFLIPLASETLHPDWLQSNANDKQLIRVKAEDAAGNTQQLELTFRVDFVVMNFAAPVLKDVGAELFATTPFGQRADLNNRQFASTEYSFTNTTGKSFNIFLSDAAQHQAQNQIESMVREHRIRTEVSTEWQVGQIMNALVLNECPKNNGWLNVTSILNYNGTGWDLKSPPAPTLGTESLVLSDNLPAAPAPSGWSDVLDFDTQFLVQEEKPLGSVLTFEYDYIVDANQYSRPAKIKNWKHTTLLLLVTTCPDVSFFQQRSAYTNVSASGYPKNLNTLAVEAMTFSTTGFTVFDNDAGAAIVAVGGWYTIPAGHRITVKKLVTTPTLTLHNDLDVANNPATFASYLPRRYDKTLTWTVERGVVISLAHDGGAANLMSMSTRDMPIRSGQFIYKLQR